MLEEADKASRLYVGVNGSSATGFRCDSLVSHVQKLFNTAHLVAMKTCPWQSLLLCVTSKKKMD